MDGFIGEIRVFGFTFAPQSWASCDGSTIPASQNQALYSIIGNRFNPNAANTVVPLPNINGQAIIGMGDQTVGTKYTVAKTVGATTATVSSSQIPSHNHSFNVAPALPTTVAAASALMFQTPGPNAIPSRCVTVVSQTSPLAPSMTFGPPTTPTTATLSPAAVVLTGGSTPHNNQQPYLAMKFCICLDGVYPMKSDS